MPERGTREERMVSLAIEKARKAKEELSAKKRKNIEPTQVLEIDTDPEVEKIKRPKVQDVKTKITNNDGTHSGYGLAGESLKKQDKPKKMVSFKNTTKDVRSAESYKDKKPLNVEKLIGKTGAVDEIQDMIEKEFGKVTDGSNSSYYPSFIVPINLIIHAESTRGDSEDYTIKKIEFMKK